MRASPPRLLTVNPQRVTIGGMSDEKFYNTREAAEKLNTSERTIRRWARRENIGVKISERIWVYTDNDLEKLKQLINPAAGNPNWTKPAE